MKAVVVILFLGSFLVHGQPAMNPKYKQGAPETQFLLKVAEAARLHDADALLAYMEPAYKRAQHDEFLSGRTIQFLNEFFWCEENILFTALTGVALVNYKLLPKSKTDYEVVFFISDGQKQCECTFGMKKNPGTNVFSIYGAVG
jgi:hypothetical protein